MTVETIKEAISRLPDEERHLLAAWLNELDYDDWDHEMVVDFSSGGRGMAMAESIKHEIAQGKAVLFEDGLKRAKQNPRRR